MDRAALAQRYTAVKAGIPEKVKLIAVSKLRTAEEIQVLYDLGHRAFGENYPQELRDKQPLLPPDIEWHFIGHLQTNKVKYLGSHTHLVHGVDSSKLMDELDKRAATNGLVQDILLQVHIAREETKHGMLQEEVAHVVARQTSTPWQNLRIRGLMGMASNTGERSLVQQEFRGLAGFFGELRASGTTDPTIFTELSMGMSGDVDLAIEAGTTMVRIGTAIFGERGAGTKP